MVERAVGRAEAGLQEDAAIGNGLQWRGALVREAKPDEELKGQGGTSAREGRHLAAAPGSQGQGWVGTFLHGGRVQWRVEKTP